MKYFVVSDIHSYYKELMKALDENGFDIQNDNHKLIVCGDAFDRGPDSYKVLNFLKELKAKNKLIYIRGNHEDLLLDLFRVGYVTEQDKYNGTFRTIVDLAKGYSNELIDDFDAEMDFKPICKLAKKTGVIDFILHNTIDYFELKDYIFVHGYIPTYSFADYYEYNPNWRNAKASDWDKARWYNGMKLCMFDNVREDKKNIVCGHWHASYGHVRDMYKWQYAYETEAQRLEFKLGLDVFKTYYGKGVICLDACTTYSHFVNVLVVEE